MSYQSVGVSGVTGVYNKIPEYAREFKNEYLFIRGINKTCEKFVKRLDLDAKIFDTPQSYQLMLFIRRFLKAQELGYINNISKLYFKEKDVRFIESLELGLDDYMDLFYDPDSYKFVQEKYDSSGFKKFYESFSKFKDKIKIEEMTYSKFILTDSDDDEFDIFLPDSDSD